MAAANLPPIPAWAMQRIMGAFRDLGIAPQYCAVSGELLIQSNVVARAFAMDEQDVIETIKQHGLEHVPATLRGERH